MMSENFDETESNTRSRLLKLPKNQPDCLQRRREKRDRVRVAQNPRNALGFASLNPTYKEMASFSIN
jgi:hypothetical protein